MHQYLDLLRDIQKNGVKKENRTGVDAISIFGRQLRFDLEQGFPLVTTKKIHWKSVVEELLWFLRGETNIASLNKSGVTIWNEWADENGDLGPIYGRQWRHWETASGTVVDQLADVIGQIKQNQHSRRLLVSAWNVGELPHMRLPPCHVLFQFHVTHGKLSCQLYQRSADTFLGVPFNIASYALLTHLVAACCHLSIGEFIHTFGDAHIYDNHWQQVATQLQRSPKPLPTLTINPTKIGADINDFSADDISLCGYDPHPAIPAPVAI